MQIKITPRESSGDSNVELPSATADLDPLERSQGRVEKRKRESPETMDNGKSVRPRTVAERKRRNTIRYVLALVCQRGLRSSHGFGHGQLHSLQRH